MQKLLEIRWQKLSGRPAHVQCLAIRGIAGSNIQRTSRKRIFRYLHHYRLIKTLPRKRFDTHVYLQRIAGLDLFFIHLNGLDICCFACV